MGFKAFFLILGLLYSTLALTAEPVYLMLDIDKTTLTEVLASRYKNNPDVQAIHYSPSPEQYRTFETRLKAPPNAKKIIHFELLPRGKAIGYVSARPALLKFLEKIKPGLADGSIKLLVTSLNDPPRTEAIIQQLKVGEETLAQWGAVYVPRDLFEAKDNSKQISMLRKNLSIPKNANVIAIDDYPKNVVPSSKLDRVIGVSAYDFNEAHDVMEEVPTDDFLTQDAKSFESIGAEVLSAALPEKVNLDCFKLYLDSHPH